MEYVAPVRPPEAVALPRKWKEKATLIAGGTNVIPGIRAKVLRPDVLMDLFCLKRLSYVKGDKKRIRIGGLTTIADFVSSEGFGL